MSRFEELRRREFARLDGLALTYLDYTGSGLAARSQLRAAARILEESVPGNPHSAHAASRLSTEWLDAARDRTLRFLGGDPDVHAVCFTANATGAARLVGEAFPFSPDSTCVLSADNHNSVNGVTSFARRRGSRRRCTMIMAARFAHPDAAITHAPRVFSAHTPFFGP